MLIPLVGLLIACAVFACIGAAVLALIPHLHRTLTNVSLFVVGAVPSSALAAIAYGWVFGDRTGELHGAAVIGLFGVLLVAGGGGLLTLIIYVRIMRTMRSQRQSGSPVNR